MIARTIDPRLIDEDKRKLVDEDTHCAGARERYDFSNFVGSGGPMRQSSSRSPGGRDQHDGAGPRRIGTGKELISTPFTTARCARRNRSSK
jgi:hypothetical protein